MLTQCLDNIKLMNFKLFSNTFVMKDDSLDDESSASSSEGQSQGRLSPRNSPPNSRSPTTGAGGLGEDSSSSSNSSIGEKSSINRGSASESGTSNVSAQLTQRLIGIMLQVWLNSAALLKKSIAYYQRKHAAHSSSSSSSDQKNKGTHASPIQKPSSNPSSQTPTPQSSREKLILDNQKVLLATAGKSILSVLRESVNLAQEKEFKTEGAGGDVSVGDRQMAVLIGRDLLLALVTCM